MKELKISAIREGTVIDHIPANVTFKVLDILGLLNASSENILSVAVNLPSKTLGTKGILKIGGKFLTESEFDKISLVAPTATINIVKDYTVKEKKRVSIPQSYKGIIKCPNPKCVSSTEQTSKTFDVVNKNPIKLRCHYCERVITTDDVELI